MPDPFAFETAFGNWVAALMVGAEGEAAAIEGKTTQGGKDKQQVARTYGERMDVRERPCNGSGEGVRKVERDNGHPKAALQTGDRRLLTVTIDAMGCRENIALSIKAAKAEYVLTVKGNQGSLHEEIIDEFRFASKRPQQAGIVFWHGRIETQKCKVWTEFKHISDPKKWAGPQPLVRMESAREFKKTRKIETATRCYISPLDGNKGSFQKIIRNHWHVENKLH